MRALILSAGYGTRLGDLTRSMPKPMLPIHGRPILEYIVRNLFAQGIREIAINLHFMSELIVNYFGTGRDFDVQLTYSHESQLLGTAGAVRPLSHFLCSGESFLVHYGDVLTDQDFNAMHEFHLARNALTTILLHRRPHSNSAVVLDSQSRVTSFEERPASSAIVEGDLHWVNSGVYICSSAVLDLIPDSVPCDFPRDIFPTLVDTGRLFGFPLSGYRCAIDSTARLVEAGAALADGTCRVPVRIPRPL